ncbi:MAG: LEA type 2 family protein [Proteobacteria bacterium]|nr:LEA type 2 family protein [Pseudomonadota bacterium]
MNGKRLLLTVMMLPLVMGSCALLGQSIRAPEVNLADIRLEDITVFESTFTVMLRVQNRNPVALPLTGAELDLSLNGTKLLSALSDSRESIPAMGSMVIPVKAHVSNLKVIPFLAGILREVQSEQGLQKVDYGLKGLVHLQRGFFSLPSLSFSNSGELSLATVQKLHDSLLPQGAGQVLKGLQL